MISQKELEKALKEGILVQGEGGSFAPNQGRTTLLWHPTLQRWAIAYGMGPSDAGFVLLEDFGRLWKLR